MTVEEAIESFRHSIAMAEIDLKLNRKNMSVEREINLLDQIERNTMAIEALSEPTTIKEAKEEVLMEILNYTYGMLTTEKFGLQQKIASMLHDIGADSEPTMTDTDLISRKAVIELTESHKATDESMGIYEDVLSLPTATPTRPKAIDDTLSRKIYDHAETKDIYSLDGTVSTMLVIGVDTVMDIIADYLKGGDSDA